MKIAFINQPFDQIYGGNRNSIALWSYRAATELRDRHEVSIYGSRFGSVDRIEEDGITYHGFDVESDNRRLKFLRFLKVIFNGRRAFFATPWYFGIYYRNLVTAIAKKDFDVVHIHNFPQVVGMVKSHCKEGCRIVLHMHCDWLIQLHQPWVEKALRQVDLVVGCSDYVVDGIKRKYPKYSHKCRRIFNGFDSSGFYKSPKEEPPADVSGPYMLYVGRGSPEKGLHLATRAFQKIAGRFPELKLVCVGGIGAAPRAFLYDLVDEDVRRDMEPSMYEPYEDYVFDGIAPEVRSRIQMIDHVDYDSLVSFYQNSKLLIVPTVCHEAFGMPVLEAIACGTPIVASKCGGIPEFFKDGTDGYLFERGNLKSLIEKIEMLLEASVPLRPDEELQSSFRLFSWKSITNELSMCYQSLAKIG